MLLLALSVLQVPIRGSLAAVRGPLVLYDRAIVRWPPATTGSTGSWLAWSDYPPALVDALLASEDSRFWWHPGVDPIGTGRALLTNLVGRRVLEGGSTLTQQLARSLYPEQVGQGETLGRKWRELLVALQLEARFSKHDLLLSYLNRVYLGAGWGFEDGASRFFDKSASRLELEEAALLVGLLPSPNGYDPCVDPRGGPGLPQPGARQDGRQRPDRRRSGPRGPSAADPAGAPTPAAPAERRAAPFYSDQVRRDLENLVGAEVAPEGNFLIHTHLDPSLQTRWSSSCGDRWIGRPPAASPRGRWWCLTAATEASWPSPAAGITARASSTGLPWPCGNRAAPSNSCPTWWPWSRGPNREIAIGCGPLRWRGQFFTSGCGGTLSLRQALAMSSNTAALRVARKVGLEAVVNKARDLGITSPLATGAGPGAGSERSDPAGTHRRLRRRRQWRPLASAHHHPAPHRRGTLSGRGSAAGRSTPPSSASKPVRRAVPRHRQLAVAKATRRASAHRHRPPAGG